MTPGARVTDQWIRCFQPRPEAKVQLVCLPHAGGSASFYFPVSRGLPAGIEVLAVQYPGRQDRRNERCRDDVGELADEITDALTARLDRPFALFGHSMGAVLAYEVARRYGRGHGASPLALFASGRRAPSRRREEYVHRLDDGGIVDRLRRLQGTDAQVLGDEELLRMVLPAIRGDYRAIETYRHEPGPPLRCPVVALVGDADPMTTLDEARAWCEHTSAAFDLQVFPGGHFFLAAHQRAVLDTVERTLRPHAG